jgi:hypothetical protein
MTQTTTPDAWPFTGDEPCDCGGDHPTDAHETARALDDDFDAWSDR